MLVVAKRSARQARVKAIVQMRHLGITAPEQLHSRLKSLTSPHLVARSRSHSEARMPYLRVNVNFAVATFGTGEESVT